MFRCRAQLEERFEDLAVTANGSILPESPVLALSIPGHFVTIEHCTPELRPFVQSTYDKQFVVLGKSQGER